MQLTLDFPSPLDSSISKLLIEGKELRLSSRSQATRAGYAHDWKMFERWCHSANRASFPASIQTVCLFVTDQLSNGRKVSTTQRRLHGVLDTLRERGCPLDASADGPQAIISGAQRLRCEQPRQMSPLTVVQVGQIAEQLARDGTRLAIRDRSIITLGFASALRRWNLAELKTDDIAFCGREGVLLKVRREKQDQTGKGRTVAVPRGSGPACAVSALEDWLAIRGNTGGPLFVALDPERRGKFAALHPRAIWKCTKRNVSKVGLDPTLYGAHSMRAGFVTEALSRGVGEIRVASHTGHKSLDCLRRYFRPRDLFTNSACSAIGL